MATTRSQTAPQQGMRPSPSVRSQRALDWLNFFVADVQTGMGPFVTIYLTMHGWTQGAIGSALTAGTIAQLVSQAPGGALVDWTHTKRAVIAFALGMIAVGSALIGLFPTYLPVAGGEVLHGLTGSVIRPALAAIGLGLVGHRAFNERLGRNHRYDSLGNGLTAAAMGAMGYLVSRQAPFFVTIALCLPAGYMLLRIRGNEIDYARARGAAGRREPKAARWRDLAKDRRILVLAGCMVLFQFADASILMLATERLATDLKHMSELVTSAMVVVPQLIAAMLALRISRMANDRGRKPLLIAGFAALLLRTLLIAFVTAPWFLVLAQTLDGITAAAIGVVQPLAIADMTKGTGRYNATLGAIGAANMAGASVSTTVIGFLAQRAGFTLGFGALSLSALGGLALLWWRLPETSDIALQEE